MGKGNKNGRRTHAPAKPQTQRTDDAPAEETKVEATTVVKEGKALPGVLKVKPGMALRGARDLWYKVLLAHDGKPVAEFLAKCKETPPSLPKSGIAEKPSGWLKYFLRTQACVVEAPTAPATVTEAPAEA